MEHNVRSDARDELHDRPAADPVKLLSEQTRTLVQQEIELAKLELTGKAKRAGKGGGMFGGAAVLAVYAVERSPPASSWL